MNESELLLRQLDGHLADLRVDRDPVEFALAEHLAADLRQLVAETASASAAERARVRAAVHYFVVGRHVRRTGRAFAGGPPTGRRAGSRPITEDVRVVNAILGG